MQYSAYYLRLALALLVVAPACDLVSTEASGVERSTGAGCSDPDRCCEIEEVVCLGDPDQQVVCSCGGFWTCDSSGRKCQRPRPTPGGGTWSCAWSEWSYTCESPSALPPAGEDSGWQCEHWSRRVAQCTRDKTVLPPFGAGQWQCQVSGEFISCSESGVAAPDSRPTISKALGPSVSEHASDPIYTPGVGRWQCFLGQAQQRICEGSGPEGATGAENAQGWECTPLGGERYRCEQVAR